MLTPERSSVAAVGRTIPYSRIGFAFSLTIFIVAVFVLYHLLHGINVRELIRALKATDERTLVIAGCFVAAGYLTLTFYDLFALRTIGRTDVPYRVAALGGFTSYAVGHNIGASVFSGGAVRYRIYSRWGLSVIDVGQAETNPATALKATVPAGCVPIRVITSDAGKYVWVTARDSNALLAFSAARLLSDSRHALIAQVGVGQGPVGITIIGHSNRIIIADSNLHTRKGASANLIVVDAAAALAGKPALLGVIPAGLLPRQLAQVPGSTTLPATAPIISGVRRLPD